jgi:hypothetical protein
MLIQSCQSFMGKRMGALPAAMLIAVLSIIPSSARTPRPIIIDGTVKAANGDLLRGTTLHISKTYTARANNYGLSYSNMLILRDQCHINLIRLGIVDPFEVGNGVSAFDSIEQTYYWADSIIKVCDSLGMYVQFNFHSPFYNWTPAGRPWAEWDVRNFWAHYAPRYKDKPFVMYQMFNEGGPMYSLPDAGYLSQWKEVYGIVRAAAPDNIVYHADVVFLSVDTWGPYLINTYAPALGFSWDSGKDLFSYHTYVATDVHNIQRLRSSGVPLAPPEFTGSDYNSCCPPPFLDRCHYPSEWYERNGISWTLWYNWNDADQARGFRDFVVPDATQKGYAWWNTIKPPSAPKNLSARAIDSYTIGLTWDKPSDTGNGLLGYRVYRDGKEVNFPYWPKEPAFTDTGLHASTTYTYEIVPRTFGGVVGAKSSTVTCATPLDNAAPMPILVSGAGDGTKVHIVFGEPIEQTFAQTISNFSMSSGIAISAASLAPDQKTITLTTSKMTKGTSYTLTMSNIADRAVAPNTIPPNSAFPFKYVDGVTRIRVYPRTGFAPRLGCGVFEGTNGSKETGPYTALYAFPYINPPSTNGWIEITEAQWMAQTGYANFDKGYRYVRYSQFEEGEENAGGYSNVAEIEFYYGTVKATGTTFGSPGSYGNSGNDYTKAFDGDINTFFDYTTTTGGYTGLDLGDKGVMNAARVPPRLGCKAPDLRIAARQDILEARIMGVHSSQIVNVAIYGLQGKLVRRFAGRADAAGTALVRADNRVPAGNYLAQISAGTFKWTLPVMVEQ